MKTSDEKRREIAANLRELRHTTYYREEVVENICDVISIADPVNTFREPEDVYKLLADLIDRPTCRLVEDERGYTACSECGCTALCMLDASYCPECGARVVTDDD